MKILIIWYNYYSIVSAKDDVCKRVKDLSKLHTIECSANNNNDFCSWAGYEFVGWSDGESIVKDVSFEKGTTGNFTYTAIYTPKEDTKYTVNHYKMNLNGKYVLETTEFFYEKTDTSVTPNVK